MGLWLSVRGKELHGSVLTILNAAMPSHLQRPQSGADRLSRIVSPSMLRYMLFPSLQHPCLHVRICGKHGTRADECKPRRCDIRVKHGWCSLQELENKPEQAWSSCPCCDSGSEREASAPMLRNRSQTATLDGSRTSDSTEGLAAGPPNGGGVNNAFWISQEKVDQNILFEFPRCFSDHDDKML